jgi:hypothetical protein
VPRYARIVDRLFLARSKARLLQRQPFVVDKAARPGEAAHLLPLRTIGTKLEDVLHAIFANVCSDAHATLVERDGEDGPEPELPGAA